jgi:hypothetical protein
MSTYRQNPVRRNRRPRPPWLLPVVVAVGAVVLLGLVLGLVRLIGAVTGDDEPASAEPSSCATTMVTPADALPAANKIRVNVFNATATAGLAGKTAKELGARDYRVVRIANDPRDEKIEGVAQLRYGPKGEKSAQALLFLVPGAELVNDGRTTRIVDLAMGDQFTGLADADEVTAAMASPTPSLICETATAEPTDSAS